AGPHVVVGLPLASAHGWAVAAVAGSILLRRMLGPLRGRETLRSAAWTLGAAAIGAVVALLVDAALPLHVITDALGSIGFVVRVGIGTVIAFAITGVILSRTRLPELDVVGPLLRGLLGRLKR